MELTTSVPSQPLHRSAAVSVHCTKSCIYTVKKCSWRWANLSPETFWADLKRLINEKLLHLVCCLHGCTSDVRSTVTQTSSSQTTGSCWASEINYFIRLVLIFKSRVRSYNNYLVVNIFFTNDSLPIASHYTDYATWCHIGAHIIKCGLT